MNQISIQPIVYACEIVGGQGRLARTIGVTAGAVSQWVRGRRPVPVERCTAIEIATGGKVSRRDLRPEDWHLIWPELKESGHV